ncbi:15518_t:CDS:10 [Acaulospora morrowiae]|uniref:Actin cytoskeleton-regulatory complex protein PAN1 n=1 Tax=Acaulospora morrowiae TaxID=94023 RepID=A0A9N8V597_9GLOM|nr:15518_t:CDS:10 [Acaulospora morrowiae]
MYNIPQIAYGQSPLQPQVIASNTTSGGEGGGPIIPNGKDKLQTVDQTKFEQLYIQGVGGGKYLTGEGAREILKHSPLAGDILAKIWFAKVICVFSNVCLDLIPFARRTLSNLTSSGHLTFPEFALSMYLTNMKIKGQELPTTLPENIRNEVLGIIDQIKAIEQKQQEQQLQSQMQRSNSLSQPQMMQQQYTGMPVALNVGQYSVTPSVVAPVGTPIIQNIMPFTQRMMPQQNPPQQYSTVGLQGNAKIPWAVTPEEKIQYRTIFKQWDSTGLGYLTGEKAREILSQSGLPQNDLMQIWNLSDPNNNGKLNQDEFAVAMHLIYRKLNGYDIPVKLPPELIPPSSRDLAESVNQLKNLLTSEVHASQTGLSSISGSQYVKSRSFTGSPMVNKNDAVVYKHKDDEVGYVSAARRRVPPVSRNASSSFSSLSRSTLSESAGEEPSSKLSDLRKQIHEKQILLDALSYSSESAPRSYGYSSYSNEKIDVDDLKYKIKDIQRKVDSVRDSHPEWLSREYTRNLDDLSSLLEQHKNLDYDLNKMLSNTVPDLIFRARKISNKVADSKLELFKIRDSVQQERTWMNNRSFGFGGGGYDSFTSGRLEEETARINAEKSAHERQIEDVEKTMSKLQDYMTRVSRDREEIEEKMYQLNRNKDGRNNDKEKWEDGIGVSEEVRRFIEELKREERRSASRSEYNDTRYSSASSDTYKRSTSTNSVYITSSVPSSLSKAKTPEERAAFIKAEADRMLQERLEALGVKPTSGSEKSSPPTSPSLSDRLAREKAEAAERLARAEREVEERERARTQKLLAEKQEKAEKEAERLRKMEELERREEERRNQWLAEAKEVERAKDKKARDKEDAARAMELELEKRRLAEVEREKRQQEERLARIKREAEEREAEEERRRLEQEALVENSRAARERAKKREEEAKQREEAVRRDTEILAKSKKDEFNLNSKVSDNPAISSSPVENVSNNPFLKFSATSQSQPDENEVNKPLENTNPFFKFTTGTSTSQTIVSREVQDDDDWNVIDQNEDSSDDGFNVPVGNSKSLAAKLFGSVGVDKSPQKNQSIEVPNSEPKEKLPSPPEVSFNTTGTPSSNPPPSSSRGALLSQIQQGRKLRPTQTNDRSSPSVSGKIVGTTGSSDVPNVVNSTVSPDVPKVGLPGMAGLLAGAITNLKKNDGAETSRSVEGDQSVAVVSRQRSVAKPDRRTSADWFGSLASDQLAGEIKDSTQSQALNIQTTIEDENEKQIFGSPIEKSTIAASAEDDINYSQEFRVKSMFPYYGNGEPDSLQFESGVIFLAHPSKNESNAAWWYGVIEESGTKGWFPKTYVEIYSEEKEICKARVLYEWKAQTPEELDIKPGVIVSIIDKSLGDWWKAEYEGTKGIIPSNYVEEISSSSVHNKSDEAMTSEVEKTDDDTTEDDTSEDDEISEDDTSEDESNEIDQMSDTSSQKENETPFNATPIEIPKLNILPEQTPINKNSSLTFNVSSSSQTSSEFARSPSPTRMFGSSPITPVFWMQDGKDSNLGPNILTVAKFDGSNLGHLPSVSTWADLRIGEDLSKEERKRQEAIYELIFTEQTYLRDLQIIIEVFYDPLQDLLPKVELSMIFSNIEDILLHNTAILSDLEQRQKEDKYVVKNIGDILVKHSEGLRLYIVYCGNQLNASKFIQKKRTESKKFDDFLKMCQQNPKCGSLDLSSFLLKPLQRITRYPLLIRQILHYTRKDHEDHKMMMEALHKAEEILEETNEAAREQENKIKLSEIAKLIDLERLDEKLDLTSMTRLVGKRQYIFEGPLKKTKSGRNLYGYIFNDMLILCQQNKKAAARGYRYSLYKPPIPLNEIFVKDNGPDETCFQVIHIEDAINLRATSISVKRQWVNQLATASGYCLTVERQTQTGNMPTPADHISGTLRVLIYEGILPIELHELDNPNSIQVYCQVQLNRQIFKTKLVKDTTSPHWNQYLMFSVTALEEDVLKVSVFNYDKYSQDEYLGQAEIKLRFLTHYGDNETEKITLPLKPSGSISIYLSYKATY